MKSWQHKNVDYFMYAKDFAMFETGFDATKDALHLNALMKSDKQMWAIFDFKLLDSPPVLLPCVNPKTKLADGSFCYCSSWEVTLPATDSTAAKPGVVKLYESYDFNAEGKIR
ncbi:MAG: hypothetical protein IBX66_11310 [Lutibacter sp.]|nr:hypothetical protein [Lutibacter sp.]